MLQSFKLALKSIWGNKMRSFLTMLGIIIGVAAVIILVSLVNGYMGSVVESFASMGVNLAFPGTVSVSVFIFHGLSPLSSPYGRVHVPRYRAHVWKSITYFVK